MELKNHKGYYKSILNDDNELKILYSVELENKGIYLIITIRSNKYLSRKLNMNSSLNAKMIFSDLDNFIGDIDKCKNFYLTNIDYELLLDSVLRYFPSNFSACYKDLIDLGVRSMDLLDSYKIKQIYEA